MLLEVMKFLTSCIDFFANWGMRVVSSTFRQLPFRVLTKFFAGRLLTAAKQLALRLPSMCSQELRELLASVLWRIILQENRIEIKIRSMSLRQSEISRGQGV